MHDGRRHCFIVVLNYGGGKPKLKRKLPAVAQRYDDSAAAFGWRQEKANHGASRGAVGPMRKSGAGEQ